MQARQNFGVVELDGLIYVLGGENEETELITVEVFDPHFNSWRMQTSMTMIRKVTTQKSRTCNTVDDWDTIMTQHSTKQKIKIVAD